MLAEDISDLTSPASEISGQSKEMNGDVDSGGQDADDVQTPVQPLSGQNPMLILFTSGTTGLAKVGLHIISKDNMFFFRQQSLATVLLLSIFNKSVYHYLVQFKRKSASYCLSQSLIFLELFLHTMHLSMALVFTLSQNSQINF